MMYVIATVLCYLAVNLSCLLVLHSVMCPQWSGAALKIASIHSIAKITTTISHHPMQIHFKTIPLHTLILILLIFYSPHYSKPGHVLVHLIASLLLMNT